MELVDGVAAFAFCGDRVEGLWSGVDVGLAGIQDAVGGQQDLVAEGDDGFGVATASA